MSKRVMFFGTNNSTLENEYTLGSGVGRKTISISNALSKRAVIPVNKRVVFNITLIPGRPRKF